MANFKRHKPVTQSSRHGPKNMNSWPKWWDVIFHTRPRRRKEKEQEHRLLRGESDVDACVFPLGNHKPHNYFW